MADEPLRARALFDIQIDCLKRDDREAQMKLYADDLVYEFPFATDRPRRIEGRDAFIAVMKPLWERVRGQGVKIAGIRTQVHETADPDFIVAEFAFAVGTDGNTVEFPFVQFFWTRDGKIAAVREYFSPRGRAEALGEG
jgi:ketosteroid isomerase-like protein